MENFQEELIKALGNLKNFVPVGTPWWGFDMKAKPIGVQLYQGQVLARDMYPVHWNYIQSYRTIVSEVEWFAYADAHNGMCPYFSSGDEVGTYRMPKIVDVHPRFIREGDDVGKYIEAGLPNITGDFNTGQQLGLNDSTQGTGAFYPINQSTTKYTTVGSSTANRLSGFAFDAHRSNHIYGQSDTVQPPAVNMLIGEYVVSGISEIDIVTANEIIKGIDALQADVAKVVKEDRLEKYNTAYITETWSSGTEWYRKWSDGWIEQGGRLSATAARQWSNKTLTFHIAFTNTNYTLTGIVEIISSATPGSNVFATLDYNNKATTEVTVGAYSYANGAYVQAMSWYACGY